MECTGHDYWTLNTTIKSYENDNRIIEYKYFVCNWDDSTKIHYKEDILRTSSMSDICYSHWNNIPCDKTYFKGS